MEYRAVGNRCAVILDFLRLPISRERALAILDQKGFRIVEVDIIALARQCVGVSQYRYGARPSEAPVVVDCSSFIKWLYAQRGIWLPRRSVQQRKCGEAVSLDELIAGDVVLTSGRINYYLDNSTSGVGHVGIVTGEGTVIHAANSKVNVVETPLDKFVGKTKFRGARRYIPRGIEVLTLETPPHREIEMADDIRWIILRSLPKKMR